MGYYENPPIINMNTGSEQLSKGILSMSNSIAQGLLTAGERRREREKEEKLSLQKLQQQKNEVDLLYNDKLSDWSQKVKKTNVDADKKVRDMLQTKIAAAADARILLLNETDSNKRSEYLATIRQADTFMDTAGKFAGIFAPESASYRENMSPNSYGVAGGMVVNGSPDQIEKRTMTLNVFSGMTQQYKDHSIDIEDLGDSFKFKVSATDMNGNLIEDEIDAAAYLTSAEGGSGTYLQKVINNDDWTKSASKVFYDEKNENIVQKYLSQDVEKVKIPVIIDGKDTGQYQLGEGQRLKAADIKADLREKAGIKASAFLKAGKEADLRALVNCTLKKDVHYYDDKFKIAPNKEELLTDILVNDAFENITKNLRRTGEGDNTVYWNKDVKVEDRTTYNSKDGKPAGNKESIPALTQTEYNQALKDYDTLASAKSDLSFNIVTYGPGGGEQKPINFYKQVDRDGVARIYSNSNTAPFSRKDFREYLKGKMNRRALIAP